MNKKIKYIIIMFFLLLGIKTSFADSKIADLYYLPQGFISQVLDNGYIQDIGGDGNTYNYIYDFYGNKINESGEYNKGGLLFLNLGDKVFNFLFYQSNDYIYFNIGKIYNTGTGTELQYFWGNYNQKYDLDYTPVVKIGLTNNKLLFCFNYANNDDCSTFKYFDIINETFGDYTGNLTGNDLLPFIDNIDIRNIKIAKKIIKLNDNGILYKKSDDNIYKFMTEEDNGIGYEDIAYENDINANLKNFKWFYNGENQYWSFMYETGSTITPVTYITDINGNIIDTQPYYIINYLENGDIWKLYDPETMGINYNLGVLEPNIGFIQESDEDFKFTYSSGAELWYTNPDTTNLNITGNTKSINTNTETETTTTTDYNTDFNFFTSGWEFLPNGFALNNFIPDPYGGDLFFEIIDPNGEHKVAGPIEYGYDVKSLVQYPYHQVNGSYKVMAIYVYNGYKTYPFGRDFIDYEITIAETTASPYDVNPILTCDNNNDGTITWWESVNCDTGTNSILENIFIWFKKVFGIIDGVKHIENEVEKITDDKEIWGTKNLNSFLNKIDFNIIPKANASNPIVDNMQVLSVEAMEEQKILKNTYKLFYATMFLIMFVLLIGILYLIRK